MYIKSLARLFYTVRYLRWEQVYFRLYYKLFAKTKVPPAFDENIGTASFCWDGPSFNAPSLFEGGRAVFLGEEGNISRTDDWNTPSKSKLWLYNAHYFDGLNTSDGSQADSLEYDWVVRWIDGNPPPWGNGWEPYPISLRVVNWIKWISRQGTKDQRVLQSLKQQCEVLLQRLEYHILGNHLFANAKALVFAGVFLDDERSEAYLQKGLLLLNRELKEQFLDDGGHFERSPMYHAILLWDILDVLYLSKLSRHPELEQHVNSWIELAKKALSWLEVMIHQDREVSFFNDSSIGIAAPPADIFSYAQVCGVSTTERKKEGLSLLKDSGYSRVTRGNHMLFFDHAPVGPDYLPGHAHADSLSIEWSVAGQRVLVNSGTSLYGVSPERLRQRSTAAHNTVVVNEADSSEVWSGFRVARRASCEVIEVYEGDSETRVTANHDGYKRFSGKPIHQRTVVSTAQVLKITDTVVGEFYSARALYHLHPDAKVTLVAEQVLRLDLPNHMSVMVKSMHPLRVENSTWHPEFGMNVPNKRILVDFGDNSSLTVLFELT